MLNISRVHKSNISRNFEEAIEPPFLRKQDFCLNPGLYHCMADLRFYLFGSNQTFLTLGTQKLLLIQKFSVEYTYHGRCSNTCLFRLLDSLSKLILSNRLDSNNSDGLKSSDVKLSISEIHLLDKPNARCATYGQNVTLKHLQGQILFVSTKDSSTLQDIFGLLY